MELGFRDIGSLFGVTILRPAEAARRVVGLDLRLAQRWMICVLCAVLSALIFHLTFPLQDPVFRELFATVSLNPISTAIAQVVAIVAMAGIMLGVGRLAGGTGRFPEALVLCSWLQVALLCVEAAQLLIVAVAPILEGIVSLVGAALFFWIVVQFASVLHGFRSRALVFFATLAIIMALGLGFLMLMQSSGAIPAGG